MGPDDVEPRVAVIGDVGGHLDALQRELVRLGAHPRTLDLPAGLTIVQVGDLIHRGPDSDGVVALVDRYLREQPKQWVQIVGNHEAFYLREPVFDWPERVDSTTAAILRRWWAVGSMRVAAGLSTPTGDYLVTHAGLTAGFWRAVLAMPVTAATAAAALNGLVGNRDSAVFRTGAMVGRRPSRSAGPLWADASRELVPSWFQSRLPFGQIHGHSSITDWSTGAMRGSTAVAAHTTANAATRHETTTLAGDRIIGIDPCHGARPAPVWAAWEARLIGPVKA
jgi:hypothetical protein